MESEKKKPVKFEVKEVLIEAPKPQPIMTPEPQPDVKKETKTQIVPVIEKPTPVTIESEKKSESAKITFSNKFSTISSQIGAIITRKSPDSDEEEEEESRMKQPSVSSVIKVSERKYAVPKSMQPSKAILLKAVDEANSSVKTRKSMADEKMEKIRSKRGQERSEEKKTEAVSKRVSSDEVKESRLKRFKRSLSPSAEVKTSKHRKETIEEGDRRKAVIATEEEERIVSKSMPFGQTDRRQVQIESEEMFEPKIQKEPKFIITLNGLNDDTFLKRIQTSPERPDSQLAMSEEGDDQMEALEINADYENDENMDLDDEVRPQSTKKKLVRCTFWPMCDKGEQCQFLHPKKPCSTFPTCPFGQQCHYLHPSCRFDGFCNKTDCPYTHVIKKPVAVSVAEVPTSTTSLQTQSETTQSAVAPVVPIADPIIKPSSNGQPKITINKIQPYSLVNKPNQAPSQVTSNATLSPVKDAVVVPMKPAPAPNSFPIYRMPRAAPTGKTFNYL